MLNMNRPWLLVGVNQDRTMTFFVTFESESLDLDVSHVDRKQTGFGYNSLLNSLPVVKCVQLLFVLMETS